MNEMKTICRFCMKTTEKPLLIDKMTKEIVEILMPKLDLKITPESVLCYGCAETLQTAFDFKSACIYTKDCLYPFIEGRCEARLDLQEIYLKVNDNKDIDSVKGREVCRFCMKPCNSDRCTPIDVIEENVEIKKLLEDYLPEVVKGVIEKPVACENCRNFLHQYSLFVTSFSGVEQQIQSYAKKTLGRDCISEIDLSQVRDFSLGNVTKRGVETIVNDKVMEEGVIIFSEIEREEIKCEEKEICESKIDVAALETERREQEEFDSFAGSDELFRSNQVPLIEEAHADIEMKCPFLEPLETEIKVKYFEEDVIHIEEMKGESEENERALSPHRIEECQELEGCLGIKLEGFEIKKDDDGNENNTVSLIDPSIIFSEDIEIKPTVVETTYNPEATHTAIESGPHQNAPEIETSLQVKSVQDVEGTFYRCELCPYKAKFNCYLTRHMLVHKDISEVTAHRCNLCPYETKRKHDLTAHMLIHKDPSEVTTYHCNFCSYKTKRRRRLNLHMLVHKNTSENAVEIETTPPVKLVKDVEKTIYKCKHCPYKTKRKNNFNNHVLVHKNISEVKTYDCSFCSYKAKRKGDLTSHMLIHKDFSEVTTYDCDFCSYKTKRKSGLRTHMLTHQDKPKNAPEIGTSLPVKLAKEVQGKIYNCELCPYKTNRRSHFNNHLLVHKDISEVTSYQCPLCPYKTKRKADLLKHIKQTHKGSSQVESVEDLKKRIYHCKICPYKAKQKHNLTGHMMVHKDISEVSAHRCQLCPYKTKWKSSLSTHMLIHKDISEVTTYDCNFCPFKSKRKHGLISHMPIHMDNSKVKLGDVEETIYHCIFCPYKAKLKKYLTTHMLVHKDISEVTAHRCKLCPYETKRKGHLTQHLNRTHKGASQDVKSAQNQQESVSEHQELEGCSAIKSEEVDIKDEDEYDDEFNRL